MIYKIVHVYYKSRLIKKIMWLKLYMDSLINCHIVANL